MKTISKSVAMIIVLAMMIFSENAYAKVYCEYCNKSISSRSLIRNIKSCCNECHKKREQKNWFT